LSKARSIGAGVLGVLAVLGLVLSVFALWARAVLFDEDAASAAVERALDEPFVTEALAAEVTRAVFESVDVEAAVEEILPDRLDRLTDTVVRGVHNQVEAGVTAALETDAIRALVGRAVEVSHRSFLRLLQGDGMTDGIAVVDGEVTINTLPLIGRALGIVQELGFLSSAELPDLTIEGGRADQIARLEEATGRDLSDDFGQVTVFSSETLRRAGDVIANLQRVLVVAKRALVVIVLVTVASIVGAIALARQRGRAAMLLLGGIALGFLFARLAIGVALNRLPNVVASPDGQVAIDNIVTDLTSGLTRSVMLIALVAIAATAALWFLRGRPVHPDDRGLTTDDRPTEAPPTAVVPTEP